MCMYKASLKMHLIFVVKYRKNLLIGRIRELILNIFQRTSEESKFTIEVMETDKNHIHMMIEYLPSVSVSAIVRKLKQISTNKLWKNYGDFLSKHFWKEHTFWSDGYFACSIGNACEETIRKYIENQG